MPFIKKLLTTSCVQAAAAWCLAAYIRFVYATSRKTLRIDEKAEPYVRGKENAIFSFWHGRMMMLPAFCPQGRSMHVLISRHRDGALISRIIAHFGQATVSGSTSRGGKEAAGEIMRALKNGDNVSITPDGPRGPSQIAAKGAVTIARLAKKPVLPVTFAASRAIRLKSWDRFVLALPFGRIALLAGAPITMPEETNDAEEEQMRQQLEQAMNRLVEMAEREIHG